MEAPSSGRREGAKECHLPLQILAHFSFGSVQVTDSIDARFGTWNAS